MNVPFSNLKAIYTRLRPEIDAAVARVFESGWYIGGPENEAFETAFAAFAESAYAAGVAHGTDAISLALRALGVQAGDKVVVPAVSAYPTTVAVTQMGAVPVFVDVNENDALMDVSQVAGVITDSTRAIVAVHLYGMPADAAALAVIAEKHGLPLIEDCAQAHGARLHNRAVGTFGAAAAWSFYPTKNLGAFGDAGAVTSNSVDTISRVRRLGNYGQTRRFEHDEPGVNSRLDPIQAAILAVRLKHLPAENQRRAEIASNYRRELRDVKGIRLFEIPETSTSSNHLFPVLVRDSKRRDAFREHMGASGIETAVHYPLPMTSQKATRVEWLHGKSFPVASMICASVVSLPLHPDLLDEEVNAVIRAVQQFGE